MSTTSPSFPHFPRILPADSLSAMDVLALVGVLIWVAALAWFVLADVFHAVDHSHKHHHHSGSSHGPDRRSR